MRLFSGFDKSVRFSPLEDEVMWSVIAAVASQRTVSLLSGARSDYGYQTKSIQAVRILGFCIRDGWILSTDIHKWFFSAGMAVLVLYSQMLWGILYLFVACSKSNKYLELEADYPTVRKGAFKLSNLSS